MRLSFSFFLLFVAITLSGQDQSVVEKGSVSYVSSQSVYVKFESTDNIAIGDTLYVQRGQQRLAALVVASKSSISCVCTALIQEPFNVSDEVIFVRTAVPAPPPVMEEADQEPVKEPAAPLPGKEPEPVLEEEESEPSYRQKITGRISAASYSNISNSRTNHRMRYAFTLRGDHIRNSRFSTDSYITFRHTLGEWQDVKDNLNDAIKVYSLAVRYDLDPETSLILGRKINPRISSMGAIDGVQFEKRFGHFLTGALAGSRPDFSDYSINPNLVQAGAYIGFASDASRKYHQSTLAFVEQRNHSNTDRRFVYFQHTNTLLNDLNVFTSFEFDLYENIHESVRNTLTLTNLFASLRYRFSRNLSVSASYDNRKNIIYYESYKNFIDQLIDDETRQGLRLGFNYRPFKYVTWGVNASWRFQKDNKNDSRNLNTYLNISRLPFANIRTSITANFLQTGYLDSRSLGIRISKDLLSGKLNADAYYRKVDYTYSNSDYAIHQHIGGVNLSVRLMKHLSLHLYYEGTFNNKTENLTRFNTKIIQRF